MLLTVLSLLFRFSRYRSFLEKMHYGSPHISVIFQFIKMVKQHFYRVDRFVTIIIIKKLFIFNYLRYMGIYHNQSENSVTKKKLFYII